MQYDFLVWYCTWERASCLCLARQHRSLSLTGCLHMDTATIHFFSQVPWIRFWILSSQVKNINGWDYQGQKAICIQGWPKIHLCDFLSHKRCCSSQEARVSWPWVNIKTVWWACLNLALSIPQILPQSHNFGVEGALPLCAGGLQVLTDNSRMVVFFKKWTTIWSWVINVTKPFFCKLTSDSGKSPLNYVDATNTSGWSYPHSVK